jgi:hypothetical protein
LPALIVSAFVTLVVIKIQEHLAFILFTAGLIFLGRLLHGYLKSQDATLMESASMPKSKPIDPVPMSTSQFETIEPRIEVSRDSESYGQDVPSSGLIISEPWISMILSGEKTWEMRASKTKKREVIALLRKGSGQVVGLTTLYDGQGPHTLDELRMNVHNHHVPIEQIGKWKSSWRIRDTRALPVPVKYTHAPGAVIWVALDEDT